jgi:hypothetical protein
MDYHADRFADLSLVITRPDGELLGILPAHRTGDVVVSHGGLTYGGFVTDGRMRTALMLDMFLRVQEFLAERGVRRVVYKTVPHIYHLVPAEEDLYALARIGARLVRRDLLSVVRPRGGIRFQDRRLRGVRKAEADDVRVDRCEDYEAFWQILQQNLLAAHGIRPVHTLAEIQRLHALFPDHIKLYAAHRSSEMIGGTLIYETPTVAHAQYIAASDAGRSCRALDLLFYYLLTDVYREKPYFDFGISAENGGRDLNVGLIEFKEGFGARGVTHDFYEFEIAPPETDGGCR